MSGLDSHILVRRGDFTLELDLAIGVAQTVALLGPNGAGKTTTVAVLAGLAAIDSGTIELDGVVLDDPERDVFVPPEQRGVGVVFQDHLLFPHLTALENVSFGLRNRGLDKRSTKDRAAAALADVGLSGAADRSPDQLSGGEQQRVALARALVVEPALLLLDEPMAALDVGTRPQVRQVMARHLAKFPGPRLLITHDPAEAFLLADRILILEGGKVTQTGTPDEIRLSPRTPYVAEVAGANLLTGVSDGSIVHVGGHSLHAVGVDFEGDAMVSIPATAISIHPDRPTGSPRNAWLTRVYQLEKAGPRVRLRTGGPLALTVELTESARQELSLSEGSEVWLAIKATEIRVQQA